MDVIVEEATTLPDGTAISLVKTKRKGAAITSTKLIALFGNKRVELRVNDVPPHCFASYLKLMLREIQRQRLTITEKPELTPDIARPKDIKEFVRAMAALGMLMIDATLDAPQPVKPNKRKVKKTTATANNGNNPF